MKSSRSYLKYLVVLVVMFAIVVFLYSNRHSLLGLSIHKMRRYILSYGKFASLAFIIIYSIKPIALIIPTGLISILAAMIFKPYYALLLSMIGCFGSATLAFFLSRYLGRSFVDKVVKGKAMDLDRGIEKHGFKIMLLMRLAVIFPYDPLSYAAGLSKMKYRDFILGTLIGIFPEMVSYSLIGKGLSHSFSFQILIPIGVVIVIAATALYMYKSSKNVNNL